MVEAFASAAASGDLVALIGVLDPDVVLVSDGGGLVTSARRPVLGADRVARFLLGILAREQPGDAIDRVVVNGALGFAVYQQGQLVTIVSVTAAAGRVTRLDLIRAPGKLPAGPGNNVLRGRGPDPQEHIGTVRRRPAWPRSVADRRETVAPDPPSLRAEG